MSLRILKLEKFLWAQNGTEIQPLESYMGNDGKNSTDDIENEQWTLYQPAH